MPSEFGTDNLLAEIDDPTLGTDNLLAEIENPKLRKGVLCGQGVHRILCIDGRVI